MPGNANLPERLRALEKLTPSEVKLASFFQAAYPISLAFETPTSLGRRTGVSKATVVRFVARLGYRGFVDLQRELQKETVRRLDSPLHRCSVSQTRPKKTDLDFLGECIRQVVLDLEEAHHRIAPNDLRHAAALLADKRRTLFITGQQSSFGLAHLFWCRASYMRENVRLVDNLGSALPQQIINARANDVLLAIISRRYCLHTQRVVRAFAKRGGRVVLLADSEICPTANLAEVVLTAPPVGVRTFENRTAAVAVLHALEDAMADILGRSIFERLGLAEQLFGDLDIFSPELLDLKPE